MSRPGPGSRRFRIRIVPPSLSSVAQIGAELQAWAERGALPAATRHDLMLVYDELASNVAKHARGASLLAVGARREGGRGLLLVVEDDGAPYDPLGRPDPDVSLALADREPGGLGILLVRRLARSVSYRRRRGRNRLEIRFSL